MSIYKTTCDYCGAYIGFLVETKLFICAKCLSLCNDNEDLADLVHRIREKNKYEIAIIDIEEEE